MNRTFVYVSNAVDGDISIYRMDRASGALEALGRAAAGKMVMPLALSPDRRLLYAAIRSQPYSVATYRIDAQSGQLTRIATSPLPDSMAYLSTDRSGRFLFGASYGGDVLSVNAVGADGVPQPEPLQIVKTGRHAHSILVDPSNRFVYAANLGADRVLQFVFDAKRGPLAKIGEGFVAAAAGSGPRHLAFSPTGDIVYVNHELTGTVASYRVDAASGALTTLDVAEGVPAALDLHKGVVRGPAAPGEPPDTTPRIWTSDLHVTPDGRFVYMAERTSSSMSVLRADAATGKLAYAGNYPLAQTQPRGFAIDPRGRFMVVSGEKSDHVGVYAIDAATGALAPQGRWPGGTGANWVEIAEFD